MKKKKKILLAFVLIFLIIIAYNYFSIFWGEKKSNDISFFNKKNFINCNLQNYSGTFYNENEIKQTITKKDIIIETPLYVVKFNIHGGILTSFKLKKYFTKNNSSLENIEMISLNKNYLPCNAPLALKNSDLKLDENYDVVSYNNLLSISNKEIPIKKLIFSTKSLDRKVKVEKIFTFYSHKYVFDLELKIVNLTDKDIYNKMFLTWNEYYPYIIPNIESDFAPKELIYSKDQKIRSLSEKKFKKNNFLQTNINWLGYANKYFITSLIPKSSSLMDLYFDPTENIISLKFQNPNNIISTKQSYSYQYELYLGPKDYQILRSLSVGLENTIDYGYWIKWLSLLLLFILKSFYALVKNYGIAIICLTFLIKFIFWPLGNQSYKYMKEMQKIQPILNEIRNKYQNDKIKMNHAIMQVYVENQISPLAGCFPMILQIPVFFGLYKILFYSIELRHSPFIWWIQDLSAKDPFYITPIIMGITMLWQQKISPSFGSNTSNNSLHNKFMLLMPILFTILFLNFPSGLVLYWLINNFLSIAQQYYFEIKNNLKK